jgi:hypothetical protein
MSAPQVQLELIKTGLSAILLLLSWIVGQRILAFWERRKKQNEIDLATLAQLHRIHAEFRTIGRLWRAFGLDQPPGAPVVVPADTHWQLQLRAAAAEGEMEALVVKLATERVLTDHQVRSLGFLREAYQLLRRSIRDRAWFYWKSGSPEYTTFYTSAIELTAVLSRMARRPTPRESVQTVERVRKVCDELLNEPAFNARRSSPP